MNEEWAEFLSEIERRRTASYEVACDLSDEGKDAERVFGKVDGYDEVLRPISSLGAVSPEPTGHVRQPLRMVGRQIQPRLCSCGEPWPCNSGQKWHDGWAEDSRDGDGNLIIRYEPSGGLYKILPLEDL